MKNHLVPALKITLITMLLFGVVYPLVITLISKVAAPNGGRGEEIARNGKVVGFELIGQKFDDDRYFNSRPSAVDYNAASTGGSNKGPSNPEYLSVVQARIDTFLVHNPSVRKEQITSDLVTASGGGLDPHLSPASAKIQIARIAAIRKIDQTKLTQLVDQYTEGPLFGLFGTEKANVLKLNIALDELK